MSLIGFITACENVWLRLLRETPSDTMICVGCGSLVPWTDGPSPCCTAEGLRCHGPLPGPLTASDSDEPIE